MMQKLCSCWQKKSDQKSETPRIQDEDATYGTIDDADDERKPGVSFRTKAKSEGNKLRKSIPSTENSSKQQSEPSRRSLTFGFNFRKKQKSAPNRELPKLPKKTFSRNLPAIDDIINPTYESIDAENDSISDPLYSKVDENPASQRYDYPTFRTKIIASTAAAASKRKIPPSSGNTNTEEPLYTSASQIYSGGSEDPYSSIVSESGGAGPSTTNRRNQNNVRFDDNNSSIYDPGYARVKDPPKSSAMKDSNPGPSNLSSSNREMPLNIDQLYAKINRPSVRRPRSIHDDIPDLGTSIDIPGPSTSSSSNRPTVVSFAQDLNNQNNESGSGSVVSGSSANPSYRYLTVRETVDVVRERIRQRQANQSSDISDGNSSDRPIREHYYSTIANEYETVGGGSLNDSIYGVAIPVVNASARTAIRETVDVVRERIRQRQANQSSDISDGNSSDRPIREHYYSTIANEYETVGGGSLNDSIYGVAIPVVNASARTASPLTLNVARLSGIFEVDAHPPRPPTSPIPNRQPPASSSTLSSTTTISRPIVLQQFPSTSRMSTSLIGPTRILTSPTTTATSATLTMGEEKANSNPNLSQQQRSTTTRITETFQSGPTTFLNSWHSQTAAAAAAMNNRILFPRGTPRIIPPVSSAMNNRILFPRGTPRIIPPVSTGTVFTTTSIKSQDSFQSQRSIDTPTKDLVDSETQTNTSSRIPISTARLNRQRSQSPAVDSSTQTNGDRARLNLSTIKSSSSLNPLPSGRDY
uniref:Uncharacterized protein n=1 Tax=Panagrolaimus sp. ES5 TaxID=591445 RepID=A0AC34F7N1_9BILA